MPAVSHCPRCTALVSLPAGVDPEVRVRCPLCEHEYPLGDALEKAPPELIVVDLAPASAPAPADRPPSSGRPQHEAASVDEPVGGDVLLGKDEPVGSETVPIGAIRWEEPPEEDRQGAEVAEADRGPAADEPEIELEEGPPAGQPDEADGRFAAVDEQLDRQLSEELDQLLAEPPLAPPEPAASDAGQPFAATIAVGLDTEAEPVRRRPSALRTMMGIVGGGVCGLAIGYLVLLWIGGPSKDFLKIGCDLPAFLLPRAFQAAGGGPVDSGLAGAGPAGAPPVVGTADRVAREDVAPGAAGSSGHGPKSDLAAAGAAQPAAASPGDRDGKTVGGQPTETVATEAAPETGRPPAAAGAAEEGRPNAAAAGGGAGEAVRPPRPAQAIAGAPTYSLDDLAEALHEARKAQAPLTAGTLADHAARRAKAQAYRTFSHLAEVATFVRPAGPANDLEPYRRAIANLVRETVERGGTFEQLELIADRWLRAASRTGRGALLAGQVASIEPAGDRYAIGLRLGRHSLRRVVTRERPAVRPGQSVVVLGAIETDPVAKIAGYQGPSELVVWAGQIVTVAPGGGR